MSDGTLHNEPATGTGGFDVTGLTLEQRASLGSGRDFWTTREITETATTPGVPSITMTDGPHGLRRQDGATDHLGIAGAVPATCFPPAACLSQSWDPDLVSRVAAAIADEALAADVQVVLGPGINIKRSPLGGRNFEYYSEDPHLSGVLGSAWVTGLQGRGVGASVKHFALNNQETDRMRVSSDVDERPLHEVYLRAFRRVVEDAEPATVMCSYNAVNGVPVRHSRELLTDILRTEWGFTGAVVSDWGAVGGRVESVRAGLDLQMPADGGTADAEVVAAVQAGDLDEDAVTTAASRVAAIAARYHREHDSAVAEGRVTPGDQGWGAHHELAREAAASSVVLLSNREVDGRHLLPLDLSGVTGSVAVIGVFADQPRYQGGGSSHVNPTRVVSVLDAVRDTWDVPVTYAPGFTVDGSGRDATLVAEAVQNAASADAAVVFLGLAADQESEGFDRTGVDLPEEQLHLLEAVAAVQNRVVVVLSHGGELALRPVLDHAGAVLDANLAGQAGGAAVADILSGRVSPSGKTTSTSPLRLRDTPSYLDFPGEHGHVRYSEGLHVGYRWYDVRELSVAVPFGHGLSYTTFGYDGVTAHVDGDVDGDGAGGAVTVTVTVTNTGHRRGREIVQVYAEVPDSAVQRVPRALVGFGTVTLDPGDSAELEIHVDPRDLEYRDTRLHRWVLESGRYVFHVGASSRDLRGRAEVVLEGNAPDVPLTLDSTVAEALEYPAVAEMIGRALGGMTGQTADESPVDQGSGTASDAGSGTASDAGSMGVGLADLLGGVPLERLIALSGGKVTREDLQKLLDAAGTR
ncbi:Thermostable beta-glucosidase B [Corynebacterium provencense]|uniref:Thermostable beta-glucosidase B n=1 Tax=Corynebacterium provencense TaxID=1737425 RepID=A0A2Z3YSU0_9CORY|nr:glycoside hydrolase family 3 C-terminal domain-containing protein [Corynebacterium provencense]AWT27359.1 Thermostable beta-glucosidase B [Corynebacterium provencense]